MLKELCYAYYKAKLATTSTTDDDNYIANGNKINNSLTFISKTWVFRKYSIIYSIKS